MACSITDNQTGESTPVKSYQDVANFMLRRTMKLMQVTQDLHGFDIATVQQPVTFMNGRFTVSKQ